ncbi:hypothetical protein C0995_013375, partial [Termitomyces sp. Mi166
MPQIRLITGSDTTTVSHDKRLVSFTPQYCSFRQSYYTRNDIRLARREAPVGAIVGGVVGDFVGLGLLIILLIICLRRRRPPPPPSPILTPLPYDQNRVESLHKNGQLEQISSEKEAAQRQHEQLQTEVERIRLRESTQNDPSGSGPGEQQQMEVLRQRILELEAQQRDLERQLYNEQPPPT